MDRVLRQPLALRLPRIGQLSQTYRPERLYLFVTLLFGLLYILFAPAGRVPDEFAHFIRAYEVSQGRLMGVREGDFGGAFAPDSFREVHRVAATRGTFRSVITASLTPGTVDWSAGPKLSFFPSAVLYSPINYLPQALGIRIAMSLGFPPAGVLLLGRLFALAACTVLFFFAIRWAGEYGWLFLLLATNPMVFHLSGSVSADSVTHSLVFLYCGLALHFSRLSKTSRTQKGVLLLLGAAIGLCKNLYFLIPLLAVPLLPERSEKRRWLFPLLLLFCSVVPNLLWTYGSSHLLSKSAFADVSAPDQFRYVLDQPIAFIGVVLRTIQAQASDWSRSFIGILGWLDIGLPEKFYAYYWWVLGALWLLSTGESKISLQTRLTSAVILVLTSLMILGVMYLVWSPVGARYISGVQGRYFIPLGPLLLLTLPRSFLRPKEFVAMILTLAWMLAVNLAGVKALFLRHFDGW